MHRNLLINLLRAVYWYADAMQVNMSMQGYPRVSRATAFLLLNVAQGEHRAINIARNLGVSRQAVSQMLTDLCRRGMLTMREDPNNRRSRIVEFSPAFAKQGAACAEVMSKLEGEISRRVGANDFKAMVQALAFNWGAPPTFPRLSRAEMSHGKEVWREEFEAEAAHDDIAKKGAPARSNGKALPARRSRRPKHKVPDREMPRIRRSPDPIRHSRGKTRTIR